MSTTLQSWAEIGLLHNLIKTLNLRKERLNEPLPSILYRAKVKLHGTNAAIQRTADGIIPQSRTVLLSEKDDNKGFARWVNGSVESLMALPQGVTVFGEWAGPGVESGMGVSKLNRKIFAVFALQFGRGEEAYLITEPEEIREVLPAHPDIFVLPWFDEAIILNFSDDISAEVDRINRTIDQVEKEDPWVKDTFGVQGLGEGVVFYPVNIGRLTMETFGRYAFKAKGEKHRTVNTKVAAQVAPETAASIQAFAKLTVTEARLSQGVSQICQGEFDIKMTGAFINWIEHDVQKECASELEASGFTWKEVLPAVKNFARGWFKAKALG